MILDIDMGNTRIKWLLREGEMIVDRGDFVAESATEFFSYIGKLKPQRVRVASVRPSFHSVFDSFCEKHWQLQAEYAVVERQFGHVINAYDDVSQMGVDRWMGIIAASQLYDAPCMVVSAGSAMTVDLLDAGSCHLGGFIVPGLQLMRQSLYRDTDQVKLADIDYDNQLRPGTNTRHAVSSGIVLMQLGLLEQSLRLLETAAGVIMVVTGGDGERLCRELKAKRTMPGISHVYYEPDLVFKGLAQVL